MERAELHILFKDKYHNTHERMITQAEFESDEAFLERARKMLEQLRHELP